MYKNYNNVISSIHSLTEFLSAGNVRLVTSDSMRILCFVLLLSGYVLTSHYTSLFYAQLATNRPKYPYNGFQSMLQDKALTVGVVNGWSIHTEIRVSKCSLKWSDFAKYFRSDHNSVEKIHLCIFFLLLGRYY